MQRDDLMSVGGEPDAATHASPGRLQSWEAAFVRKQTQAVRGPLCWPLVVVLNHLGNGWLYPLLLVALWSFHRDAALPIMARAALAAGAAHLVYPWIKRGIARPRPCDLEPDLTTSIKVLDRYSFPSGHCMTATAVAVPLCASLPHLTVATTLACALIAWARVAAAHHYPSDTLGGIALGAAMSVPITLAWP